MRIQTTSLLITVSVLWAVLLMPSQPAYAQLAAEILKAIQQGRLDSSIVGPEGTIQFGSKQPRTWSLHGHGVRSAENEEGTEPGEKKTLMINGIDYTFRWCPPGEFLMGSPASEKGHQPNEKEHRVILSRGFWLLESEVTRRMYVSVMNDGRFPNGRGAATANPQQPATGVSWENAAEFCRKLSEHSDRTFTLPTEAQWEYACRAGSQGGKNSAAELNEAAWYLGNSRTGGYYYRNGYLHFLYVGEKHDVRAKRPNAWGLYDMQGNAWEWCSDWFGADYYFSSAETDPQGPDNGWYRVVRGGSGHSAAETCRPAFRYCQPPSFKSDNLGFRIVLVP